MESRSHRSGRNEDSPDADRSRDYRGSDRDLEPRRNRRSDRTSSDREWSHRRRDADYEDDSRSGWKDYRRRNRDRSGDEASDEGRDLKRHRRRHSRSRSRDRRERRRSRSPPAKKRRSRSRSPLKRARGPLPSQDESFRGEVAPGEAPPEKQKPNFKPTGLLAKEANTVAGTNTVLKYHEPSEARKPPSKEAWRMYVFKGKDLVDTIYLHQKSAWLIGRDDNVTDLHLEHPTISKQHAVIQFRHRTTTNEYGDKSSKVKPYLIDLDSTKGTTLNGKKVEGSRYTELLDQDVVTFGGSEREYVMMLPSAEK
ncbi:hypothetical protein DOTSEDRAFT_75011 [Dothistroma septosporum NZE10]|uniref:FHA domain-containing protein n=1 Tax=Dothistroma septosporum (strain NZE10 / CBS 128990) TaxID=675120 RepID=N1PE60_DOTSN|nr:hypothetical protein DOTSEDRAFT_75011 [Dothistroma septosporum NZE10]